MLGMSQAEHRVMSDIGAELIFSKQRTPRPQRLPSTTGLDDETRKHMSQPVLNQLTNVEMRTKAKKRRESRRSTQVY